MQYSVLNWILKQEKDSIYVPEFLRAGQSLTQRKFSSLRLIFSPLPNNSCAYDLPDIASWQRANNNDTFSPPSQSSYENKTGPTDKHLVPREANRHASNISVRFARSFWLPSLPSANLFWVKKIVLIRIIGSIPVTPSSHLYTALSGREGNRRPGWPLE